MVCLNSLKRKEVLFNKKYDKFDFLARISRKGKKSYSIFVQESYKYKNYCYHIVFRDLETRMVVLHEDASKRKSENREIKEICYVNNKPRLLKEVINNAIHELQKYKNFNHIATYVYFLKDELKEFETFGFSEPW